MAFASLTANLNLNIANFAGKLTEASKQMNKFATNLNSSYTSANKALESHNLGLKDTARIVQGILVSQAFYGIARSITDATSALTQFNEQLDYAQVTYSALFGSQDLANDFVKVLQQKAVDTIFEYQDLADASKKLLAYGIEYKNLMYVMNGLTNMGAMSGDKDAMTRMSRALGQIYTKGTLKAEEMRQLADAYVPIYDIIQSSFGLTDEQMARVGDLKLPAEDVINAIVDYANEKFGSVGDAAMYTITGLKNRVVDTMKVMGSEMMMPLTTAWKSFLSYAADSLQSLRDTYSSGGWGGLFESLVPNKDMQTTLRAFLANVHNLLVSLASVLSTLGTLVGVVGQAFIVAFNFVAPIIAGVINALSAAVKVILQNSAAATALRVALVAAAGAFVLLKIHALAALVVTTVTKAINNLSKSLLLLSTLITKHPIIMLMAGIALALIGVAAASNNANNSLSGLFKTLSGFGGNVTQDDILKKTEGSINSGSDALDQFNNKFGEGSDAANDLEDSVNGVGKAAKKTSGLLSFDEVFKLPDAASTDGSNAALDDLSSFIEGFKNLSDALIPDIPDFTDFINGFTDDLFGGLFDKIKTIVGGAASGGLIGALTGFAIGALVTKTMAGALAGAKLGLTIGSIAGAGFAAFWEDTYKSLEKTLQSIAIASSVGTLVGGLTGFLIGAFTTRTMAGALTGAKYGAAIGALAGGALGGIFETFSEELNKRIESITWGSAEGALLGGVAGMIIGAFATRTMQGALTGAKYGVAIGTVVGGTIGGIFDDAEKTVEERLSNIFKSISAASTGAFWGGLAGMVIGAIVGALAGGIGAIPGAKIGATIGAAVGSLGAMLASYLQTSGITEAIEGFFTGLWSKVTETFNQLGTDIANGWEDIKTSVETKWEEIKTKASTKWEEIKTTISTKWDEIKTNATTTWNILGSTISTKWDDIKTNTGAKLEEIKTSMSTKWDEIKTNASTKWEEIKTKAGTWWDGIKTSMGTWLEDKVWKPIADFFDLSAFWERIKGLLDAIGNKISGWWEGIKSIFSGGIDIDLDANPRNIPNPTRAPAAPVVGNTASTAVNGVLAGVGLLTNKLSGHATGGIFNREHIARFAENNKAEAIIPLENAAAMQPFVNAISNGILEGLAPTMVQSTANSSNLPPMYVGTLIADERGLKQLYKKFEIIQVQENARRGLST